jgi:hypothetical protein
MNRNQQVAMKVRHGQIALLALMLALLVGFAVLAEDVASSCPETERAPDSRSIPDEALFEISGLVASRSQPGILWVHNDSGDGAVVYAIDLEGQLLAKVQLLGSDGSEIEAVDCEDIALGPGPSDSDFLFLGDIGDNARSRDTIRIYRFSEPQINVGPSGHVVQMTAECDVIEMIYPDEPRDAETLLVDPITADIVIVSKDFIRARAYRVPNRVDGTATLEFLVELSWGFMTGGDISPDGSSILLRGYWNAEIWTRSTEGNDWWTTLAKSGCTVSLAAHEEPQGEAIGFSADGTGYFSVSEGIQPSLHFYRAVSTGSSD